MAKIKASLLVSDPSFFFNIYYPDLPFYTEIKSPEGKLTACLIVSTPDSFSPEKETAIHNGGDFLLKNFIEQVKTGKVEKPVFGIECPILVTLEQKIDSKIINDYKAHKDYIDKIIGQAESEGVVQKNECGDRIPKLPTHHEKMFNVCRKYLKRFLLSLRERGNVCKIKFYDYIQPGQDFTSGLLGKYYFIFGLQDDEGNPLFSVEPLPLLREKGRPNSFKVSVPISSNEEATKRESLINQLAWERICGDLASEFEPDLARTFLLDAQDEALSGNINIAIVCTAIACEIFTKSFISSEAKINNNKIYDYIIDNVREISVVDLLHVPLKSLIGFSIKEKHNGLWKNLDRLFQARNKVAHVGKCYYMSKTKRTKTPVDPKRTMLFIESIYELFEIMENSRQWGKWGMSVKY